MSVGLVLSGRDCCTGDRRFDSLPENICPKFSPKMPLLIILPYMRSYPRQTTRRLILYVYSLPKNTISFHVHTSTRNRGLTIRLFWTWLNAFIMFFTSAPCLRVTIHQMYPETRPLISTLPSNHNSHDSTQKLMKEYSSIY